MADDQGLPAKDSQEEEAMRTGIWYSLQNLVPQDFSAMVGQLNFCEKQTYNCAALKCSAQDSGYRTNDVCALLRDVFLRLLKIMS